MDDDANVLLRAAKPEARHSSRAALVSFACAAGSLMGLIVGKWVPGGVYAYLLFIPAIIAGHVARRQFAKRPGANEGMATFGLAVGYLGLFISIVIVISMAFGMIKFSAAQ